MLNLILSDYMKFLKYKQREVFDMCISHIFHMMSVRMGRSGQIQEKDAIYRIWWEVRSEM